MEQLFLFKDMGKTKNRKSYMFNDQGRECTVCLEFKLWHCFAKNSTCAKGYHPRCRDCHALIRKKRLNDPERVKLFNNIKREYTAGDVREDGMVFIGYRIHNSPTKNFERWTTKEGYDAHLAILRKSGKNKRDELQKIEKKYKRGNVRGDGMKFWRYSPSCAYNNFEKWVTPIEFDFLKFNSARRTSMIRSLGKFGGKDELSNKIVGLNKHNLSCYIESLFEDGMTWENRGNWEGEWDPENPKWHLDHVMPLDAANTLEEAKHLWYYTNLRPMWGNENRAKSNKHCPKELAIFFEERKAAK